MFSGLLAKPDKLAAGVNPNDVRFRGDADISRWVAPIVSDAIDPKRT
jgi:hypothetical protein